MRFFADGPSIPEDLLVARDEGRVIFFCGAGVSRARAGLSDFFGLAESVIEALGVPPDRPAAEILKLARDLHARTSEGGLISADRVFGLLEREFLVRDIEGAVAQALKPSIDADLSAHRILLDLAKTTTGQVQLVTTNFDRLFSECDSSLKIWSPPHLPNPSRSREMNGVIHLHGYANEDYSGAEEGGFVLSSSEFGRAYLSDGWATEFFRDILSRYVVAFVGYTADDPPVQYLLEALNRNAGTLGMVYAFQSGIEDEASAKWRHKGVQAIPYSDSDRHRALWETLEAWSVRAKNPEVWMKSTVAMALRGPGSLEPYQRGQVAHVVSTLDGMRFFAERTPPPPAEWLCVFDSQFRYGEPGNVGSYVEEGPYFDPFDSYGLDSDPVPLKKSPEDLNEKRVVPPDAWSALATNRLDRADRRVQSLPAVRGHWSTNTPELPPRLEQLGTWISVVATQPAAVWWSANQSGLHPDIQRKIRFRLDREDVRASPVVRKAWQCLLEGWSMQLGTHRRDVYSLKDEIRIEGWSGSTVRKFATLNAPQLKTERPYLLGPKLPLSPDDIVMQDLVSVDVTYPEGSDRLDVPDEWLYLVVRELRKNLELAVQLEQEIGGYGLFSISSIVKSDEGDDRFARTHGLSGYLIYFCSLFERLVAQNPKLAKQEFSSWQLDEDRIFARIRIWASSFEAVLSPRQFHSLFAELSDLAFWDSYHQRDLLFSLAKRWSGLNESSRKAIEKRLLDGRQKYEGEEESEFIERRTWSILNRLGWLCEQGCVLSFDFNKTVQKLQPFAPNWKPEYALKAAESMEVRGGSVRTETEHSALLSTPLELILEKAAELSGRADNFLVERDPFAGLSAEHPIRAYSALTHAAKRNEFPEWAWRTFLNPNVRRNDKLKFSALIAEQITRYSDEKISFFIRAAVDWMSVASDTLGEKKPALFDKLLSKLITVLHSHPTTNETSVVRGSRDPDWVMESINAPAGKLAQLLMKVPGKRDDGGFSFEWLSHADKMLSFEGDYRRYVLVICGYQLTWLYAVDAQWSESRLMSVFSGNDGADKSALWSGFFWAARVPRLTLFLRLKPSLLEFAKNGKLPKSGYGDVLAGMIFSGWASLDKETGERITSNGELRDLLINTSDSFRTKILTQLLRLANAKDGGGNWNVSLREFLVSVWPRQLAVRSAKASARLCDIVLSSATRFEELADIVLPLLTTMDRETSMFQNLDEAEGEIAEKFPYKLLSILDAILSENVREWPYGIEALLHKISEQHPAARSDARLMDLMRIWNAR